MKEQQLTTYSDGSVKFGNGIGPSSADIEYFNKLPNRIPERNFDKSQKSQPFFLNLIDFVPKRFKKYLPQATLVGVTALGVGAVCGGGSNETKTPAPVGFGQAAQNFSDKGTEKFNSKAFLRLPMPRDPDAHVVQGWKYTALINGSFNHLATDFILGKSFDDSVTWRKFPIMAAADGVACESDYPATPQHPAGNQIEVLHSNGYSTFYIHNEPMSIAERIHQLPNCYSTPKSKWLPVEQGAKLSEASDIGAPDGWTHLHFEVKDPTGQIIDPYDLYKTRAVYPSPNFNDGVQCGDNTLWINCPIGADSGRKYETLPTRELVATVAPVETIAPVPTLKRQTEIAKTPTPEVSTGKKGIIDIDGWELRIGKWIEEPTWEYGAPSQIRKGWKRAVISGDLVNLSDSIANPFKLGQRIATDGDQIFKLVADNGDSYTLYVGVAANVPERPEYNVESFGGGSFSKGQSEPFIGSADIPQNVSNYKIEAQDRRSGQVISQVVQKGDIYQPASGESGILPGVEKHSINEPLIIDRYATVNFKQVNYLNAHTTANGSFSEEYLVFDLNNTSGHDILTKYVPGSTFDLKVYLQNGTVVDGEDRSNGGYYGLDSSDLNVAPGASGQIFVKIADNALVGSKQRQLVDTTGAVVVLTVEEAPGGPITYAWQLP